MLKVNCRFEEFFLQFDIVEMGLAMKYWYINIPMMFRVHYPFLPITFFKFMLTVCNILVYFELKKMGMLL